MKKNEPRKKFLGGAIILLILIVAGYWLYSNQIEKQVSGKVKNLYELANPGTAIEIMSIKHESGLYKILMKGNDATGTSYREVWVTKDGKLLTESLIFVEESIEQMEKMKAFVDCLDEKEVRIYGLSNHTATLLQINTLGKYSLKLYVPCDTILEECFNAGIQELPSVVFNNTAYPGVKTVEWFETITGCKLG